MIKSISKEQEIYLYKQLYENHKNIYDRVLEPILYLKKNYEEYKEGFKKYKSLYEKIMNSKSYRIGNKLINFLRLK